MEKCIAKLDFTEVDDMIQVHGEQDGPSCGSSYTATTDYEGVSLTSRTANSKNAASEATSIFQGHYPEFLVSNFRLPLMNPTDHFIDSFIFIAQEVLYLCPLRFWLDVLVVQASSLS